MIDYNLFHSNFFQFELVNTYYYGYIFMFLFLIKQILQNFFLV